MGFIKDILSPSRPRAPAPVAPEKPISPVTDRATVEGTIRRRRRSSLATSGTNRSLLNEEDTPLGT